MINIENLDKLIHHLENLSNPQTFDMRLWIHTDKDKLHQLNINDVEELIERLETEGDCGTAACIAGHTLMLADSKASVRSLRMKTISLHGSPKLAKEWLGLDDELAHQLFYANDSLLPLHKITLQMAINTLKNLKKTALQGNPEVVWAE